MLRAGIAQTNITPPLDVWMCGYAFRPSGCTAIHDELWARALVVDDGEKRIALANMDLLGLDFDLLEKVRKGVLTHTGIPPTAVMLHATHTHGGPNVRKFNTMGSRDEPYVEMLVRKLVGVVRQAADKTAPVSLTYGRATGGIGVNRRQIGPDGISFIGENPEGPAADYVDSVSIRGSGGEPLAILFSHACHPTTLGGDNLEITADWPGYSSARIQAETGAMPLFLQGCCGNINPRPRGTYSLARQHGETIAECALKAHESGRLMTGDSVGSREIVLDMPLIPPPAEEECEREIAHWEGQVEIEQKGGDRGKILHAEGLRDFARYQRFLRRQNKPVYTKQFHIQSIEIGDLQLIGLPAEMFVQYQLDFQQQSSRPTLALAYSNGVHGYIPTAADYPNRGYEVEGSHRYYGTLMAAPESEFLIRDAVYTLMGVKGPDRTPYSILTAGRRAAR